jgi:hypothetical protein
MIRPPMTTEQASALAVFLVTLRPGQRAWHKAAVFDALTVAGAKFSADAEALARAGIRAALTSSIRTPEVIAMTGAHWEAVTETPVYEPERAKLCVICGEFHKPTERCSGAVVITRSTADHIAAARLAVNGKRVKTYTPRPITDTPLPEEDA